MVWEQLQGCDGQARSQAVWANTEMPVMPVNPASSYRHGAELLLTFSQHSRRMPDWGQHSAPQGGFLSDETALQWGTGEKKEGLLWRGACVT